MYTGLILLGVPSVTSVVLIVVAILILFGGKKIPELMRGLGGGIKEFKDATREDDDNRKVEDNDSHERSQRS